MQLYQDTPLKGPNSARLLRLQLGIGKEAILCTTHAVIDIAQETYEALSYVWRSPANPEQNSCNAVSIPVTQNLYKALLALRQSAQHRYLWIDAECIIQKINEEKTHQVRNMARIYFFAQNLISWLGEADEKSHIGMLFAGHLWTLIPGRESYQDLCQYDEHGPKLTSADKQSSVKEIR
jgi:hypothetical protein